ncbi:MAG: FHA domain-containing protein, partial [Acidobacteriota bacterium]
MNSANLIVVRGPEAGLRFELSGGRNRIGASEDCDIVLKGRQLAPRHVDIEVKGELFSLSLLAPAAPCSLNGVVVGESVLRDGDHIQLGEVELLLRVEEEGERGHSLIAACSLFFLFRSMHGLDLEDQGPFEAQVR